MPESPDTHMHPALRILGVMIFIPLVAHGGLLTGLVAALGLAVSLSCLGTHALQRWLQINRRLRWFFFSIIILYGWFTPGRDLIPAFAALSPTVEGVVFGIGRAAVLAVVVGAVVWLLARTPREELVGGLLWLTAPLDPLGFPRERFAVRLVLTLETVPKLQPLVVDARGAGAGNGPDAWAKRARMLLDRVLVEARETPLGSMEISLPDRPRAGHWLRLCAILAPLVVLAVWRPL
jgi:energy-coupling factor transporter transmembrane protein EcfT